MRCALIGSGSGGNGTLVASGATTLLIDCGYSLRSFEARARALSVDPAALTGILVTHEHGDHAGGVDALARKYEIPVYATRGTRAATEARIGSLPHWQQISVHADFTLGEIQVQPVAVPHDAREPSQFIFTVETARLGLLTDVGSQTAHLADQYRLCSALILEFNHDPALLAAAVYPARLKRRIAGDYGHFSNAQSQNFLRSMQSANLKKVVAAHLSKRTNHPDLVTECLRQVAQETRGFEWSIATQDEVVPWFDV